MCITYRHACQETANMMKHLTDVGAITCPECLFIYLQQGLRGLHLLRTFALQCVAMPVGKKAPLAIQGSTRFKELTPCPEVVHVL